ncbi:MAG: type VI secretion system baseplate subunit TssE [Planctomycetia bacterium]|nr:type VI secretion system baseplate subunit TssE [Planctomycetia bacterium]
MAKHNAQNRPFLPSVLDRLLDDAPEVSKETPLSRNQVLRELKESVRRDLETLLNTRIRNLPIHTGGKELKHSLVNYGLPDVSGTSLGSPKEREEFCKVVQATIQQFEPRFKAAKVQLLTNTEPLDRTLRFRIDALLHADPAPEPIVFDSVFQPANEHFEVKGSNG